MFFPVVTFVLVLTVIVGTYWLFELRPERRARAALQHRLTSARPVKKHRLVAQPDDEEEPRSKALIALRRLCGPIQRQLDRAGLRLGLTSFLAVSACGGGLAAVIVLMGGAPAALAAAGAGVAALLPYWYVQFAASRRTWKFEEQFPEAVDLISRALRAGHALPTALGMVAGEVPDPVGTEFKKLYDQQNFGMSLPDAMRAFATRVPILDARFFVTAVLTQRESGGNLAGVLDNLSAVIRERFKVKRQVRVISAHGRITAAILSAMPPVLAAFLSVIAPDGMRMLITDPLGVRMIVGAIVLQVIGMFVMRKIVNVEF
jgi:tight adherence protein B